MPNFANFGSRGGTGLPVFVFLASGTGGFFPVFFFRAFFFLPYFFLLGFGGGVPGRIGDSQSAISAGFTPRRCPPPRKVNG